MSVLLRHFLLAVACQSLFVVLGVDARQSEEDLIGFDLEPDRLIGEDGPEPIIKKMSP